MRLDYASPVLPLQAISKGAILCPVASSSYRDADYRRKPSRLFQVTAVNKRCTKKTIYPNPPIVKSPTLEVGVIAKSPQGSDGMKTRFFHSKTQLN